MINHNQERQVVRDYVKQLNVKTSTIETVIGTLSGGNQQKVILGKWLNAGPKVFILDEPTRGIDIGAKVEIYKLLNNLVERGVTVIMISSRAARDHGHVRPRHGDVRGAGRVRPQPRGGDQGSDHELRHGQRVADDAAAP